MLIRSLKLHTVQFEELRRFYTETLGLSIIVEDHASFTVLAGLSKLTFLNAAPESEKPFYHFAFDIANNKLQASMQWLQNHKVSINRLSDQSYIAYSESWDSTSVYFYDPAGNIVEFIARHGLDNAREGYFQPSDILRISEIGLVVPDVPVSRTRITSTFSLAEYKDFNDKFAAIGDEIGLFILAERGRIWMGSDQPAAICKTEAEIECSVEDDVRFPDLPYRIISHKA